MCTRYFDLFSHVFVRHIILGSNDKSVIVWDVKGDLDLNTKLHDSSEVSFVTIIIMIYLPVGCYVVVCVEFITIIILLTIQQYVISFSGLKVHNKRNQE